MNKADLDIVFLFEMLREMLGTIDRTMLPTRATESYLEVREVTFDEARYMMVDEGINGLQKSQYLAVLLQKINDRLVQSGEGLVFVVLTGIMGSAAVEDIATAITGLIYGQALLKREGVNRY